MPLERRNVYSGAPWEEQVGYCRVTRVGEHVAVSGTAAPGPYAPPSAPEAYRQAREILERISSALADVDATLDQAIRTRMFVVDIDRDWQSLGRAHSEFFGDIRPATSVVEVRRLIDPGMLVEIEADAIVSG